MTFLVTADTREKQPWDFAAANWCAGTFSEKVDTGDYTIHGLEHLVTVDRKASTAEVAANWFDKRFDRELERMAAIAHPFVVCEFPFRHLDSFPADSGIPLCRRKYLRVTSHLLHKRFAELTLDFPAVQWVFCETRDAALTFTRGLFKRVLEKYGHIKKK